MERTGLAGRTREALRIIGIMGREVAASALAVELDMVADKEKQILYRVLRDFVKAGEITRVRRGVYIVNARKKAPQLQEIMWRVLRARRTVVVDDLVELSGASRTYAAEWIQALVRQKVVEKIRIGRLRKYRLISDPVIMPANKENREKLCKIRQQKKDKTLAALKVAELAIKAAKGMIKDD